MKKKIWIPVTVVLVILLVLFIPVPQGSYDDGGTIEYVALTYKIVDWNRIHADGVYEKTRIYFGADRNKSIDELWTEEYTEEEKSFLAVIVELNGNSVTVKPFEDEEELNSSDLICFSIDKLDNIEPCVTDRVRVYYTGQIMESYPAQINATRWEYYIEEELEPTIDYKPVIYLYPETQTEVSVNLELDGELTCTYPTYNNGWSVTARPDGTLTDSKGQTFNYLYWEGKTYAEYDLSKGFCVRGEDTAAFLENALEKLGLNRREANEFIVYWLPLMEQNPYNVISFQTDVYTDAAKLEVTPEPDTIIRVFMAWKESDDYIDLPKQELTSPERSGFTVIEWGGTEIK